ncbi:MAG: hypothetical protein ACRDZ3_05685 [Acidimicrobiia bacterium]
MDDDRAPDSRGDRPVVAPVLRAGCLALAVMGLASLFLAMPSILNPGGIRCSIARTVIDDANTDDEDFNDVETGEADVDDLACEQAITIAESIRRDEDSDRTRSIPGTGLIRNRGLMSLLVAIGQVVTGFMTLGTMARRYRTAALVFALLGVVVPVLGLLTVGILGFVVYAIGFSTAAKEVWPTKPRS